MKRLLLCLLSPPFMITDRSLDTDLAVVDAILTNETVIGGEGLVAAGTGLPAITIKLFITGRVSPRRRHGTCADISRLSFVTQA